MRKLFILPLCLSLSGLAAPTAAEQARWYDADQVAAGKKVFDRSCAGCHGSRGEAAPGWEKTDSDGHLPPPPLNGTAHTWHHPLAALRYTIRKGGAATGGLMPAFEGVLTDGDVDAVIAYLQSLWPDEIYEAWARNKDAGLSDSSGPGPSGMTARLSRLLPPEAQVGTPVATPINGMFEVSANGQILYLDDAGRYALVGDFIDLETGESLTEAKRSAERARKISSFPVEDKIVFPAEGSELAHIDVFTDTTCPYCRKLHNEVPQLQAAGVSVRYLPFPRGGENSKGYRELSAVWCDDDPVGSMHEAKTSQIIPGNDGSCDAGKAVSAGYKLGVAIGVRGTPAIVLPDGRMISGYRPYDNLVSALDIE